LTATDDFVQNEILLSRALDFEPMFMTECPELIFPWKMDENRSDGRTVVSVIQTSKGEWMRSVSKDVGLWGDSSRFPVRTIDDHKMLQGVCEEIGDRGAAIREYFRSWRKRVGEDGVVVIGHPHPSWLGYQISQENIFLHWHDLNGAYRRSADAVYNASLFVMSIAMEEGIDFMSDSSYGLEMTSPELVEAMDMPYLRAYSKWTHERDGLFWYHNCGHTRKLILDGTFNRMGADVIETIAPPHDGDNDLRESRRYLNVSICTKGNLNLGLLSHGTPDEIAAHTRRMVDSVRGHSHIFSTADAVLPGTPPENLIAFVASAREAA
jgi:hypothetical protein